MADMRPASVWGVGRRGLDGVLQTEQGVGDVMWLLLREDRDIPVRENKQIQDVCIYMI